MKKNTLTLEQKLATHFGVKIAEGGSVLKDDTDQDSRTIKAIGNTYFLIDSDQDMLVTGAAKKSIADRGPNGNAVAKIKHQADHELKSTKTVGRIDVLDERVIEGKTVLYFESYIPETRAGDENLTNYKEGLFDNHSIGFRYKQLVFASRNSVIEGEKAAWDEYYPLALNPEKADEMGFFWVVKEIELFEISVVSFGANKLTPYLGSKSMEENNKLRTELLGRVDEIAQLKSTASTKEDHKKTEMAVLQLKQIIADLKLAEPLAKDTHVNEPSKTDTVEGESKPINLLINISKQF